MYLRASDQTRRGALVYPRSAGRQLLNLRPMVAYEGGWPRDLFPKRERPEKKKPLRGGASVSTQLNRIGLGARAANLRTILIIERAGFRVFDLRDARRNVMVTADPGHVAVHASS